MRQWLKAGAAAVLAVGFVAMCSRDTTPAQPEQTDHDVVMEWEGNRLLIWNNEAADLRDCRIELERPVGPPFWARYGVVPAGDSVSIPSRDFAYRRAYNNERMPMQPGDEFSFAVLTCETPDGPVVRVH
jgi:hypothetical protein